MKNETMSIEARTVARFEEQLAQREREILQALQESESDLHKEPQNSHEERVYQ
jgi:hypothetical protein